MRDDLRKTDLDGQLDHLIEEASEIIKAVCKLKKFGALATDPKTGISYDNVKDLLDELSDFNKVQAQLVSMLSTTKSTVE